jgi:hypothetical protein
MATTTEKRRWLKAEHEAGNLTEPPPVHGVLPPSLEAMYDAAHPSANGADDDNPFGDPPDVSAAETPPARPPRAKTRPKFTAPWSKPKTGRAKAKAKRPRVPVDELIGGGWRLMTRVARPLPPLERTLKIQAPVAGLLLEDAVAGTVLDSVLQPIARVMGTGKTVAALVGPPLLVTAGTLHMQRAAMEGKQPNPAVMGVIHEGLRESLMVWMEVAGPKFDQALARERDFEARYGADVDAFIAFLFSPPPNPENPAQAQAEADAIRRVQGIVVEDAPEPAPAG